MFWDTASAHRDVSKINAFSAFQAAIFEENMRHANAKQLENESLEFQLTITRRLTFCKSTSLETKER